MIKNLDKEKDFLEEVKSGVVLVDFFATWCGPCKMLGPVLEDFSHTHSDIKILKVDIDSFTELARNYSIMSVPTLLVFKDGELKNKASGFRNSSELEEFISK